MRLLIFSDTHLTKKFDEKKFDFLSKIIHDSDRVIINGDFWEGYLTTFDEFISSPWAQLFDLLKKKNAIYLFGNHDDVSLCNEHVSLFSVEQGQSCSLMINGQKIHIEHGNRLKPSLDEKISRRKIVKRFIRPSSHIERLIVRELGKPFLNLLYRTSNKKVKRNMYEELKDHIVICGHTHKAELDREHGFINSGFIMHGLGQYLLIENDSIIGKEVWYNPPKIRARVSPRRFTERYLHTSTL